MYFKFRHADRYIAHDQRLSHKAPQRPTSTARVLPPPPPPVCHARAHGLHCVRTAQPTNLQLDAAAAATGGGIEAIISLHL
jgi:hypothetical protein